MTDFPKPVVGIVGYSGSGKTTLLETLIPLLSSQGLKIGLIKHAHHRFDIDVPGKDSHRLRKAGATQTLITSNKRWALMTETPDQTKDPVLKDCLGSLTPELTDLILVEGFKHEQYPKIEVHRQDTGRPALFPDDSNIIAVATNDEKLIARKGIESKGLPIILKLDQMEEIAQFIVKTFLSTGKSR